MDYDRSANSRASEAEVHVFDRSRLYVDLDEATDPAGQADTLLVVGFRRRRDRSQRELTENDVVLLERVERLLGSSGPIYRTRAAEVCALLDLADDEIEPLLSELQEILVELQRKGTVGIAVVAVPGEAADAVSALALADTRLATVSRRPPRHPSASLQRTAALSGTLLRWG